MTPGEKINYYRKQLGLSQEELGQKLLVSRQTISLWEKGQTVPTIDNLIRLKEIFGITVDELLGCAEEEKKSEVNLPVEKESYTFSYTKEELKRVFNQGNKHLIIRAVIVAVIVVILFVWMGIGPEEANWAGIVTGVLFFAVIILIKTLIINSKNSKKVLERLPKSVYEVKAYDEYFTVAVTRDNNVKAEYKIDYNDIEQFFDYGDFLYIEVNGINFIFRKELLSQNSVFTLLAKENPEKTVVRKKGEETIRLILNILFVATLFSLFIPLIIMSAVLPDEIMIFDSMWMFFVAVPIPITSLIMGIIYKRKGFKCKKNIVAGIILTVLLCIYGSMDFALDNTYDHSDEAIVKAEQIIGIDIPEAEHVNTQDWTIGEQTVSRGYIYSSSSISFEDSVALAFEKELEQNPIWKNEMPNELYGLLSSLSEMFVSDYYLLYNADTNELNSIPQNDGTYHFFYVGYNSERNMMRIDEYDIEYIK